MERVLEERSRDLTSPPVHQGTEESQTAPVISANTEAQPPQATQSQLRQQRRLERSEEVVALFQSGHSQGAISNALGLKRKTIRWWLSSGQFPERKPPRRPPPRVNGFSAYLQQRWN
jgi:hypothetical protein